MLEANTGIIATHRHMKDIALARNAEQVGIRMNCIGADRWLTLANGSGRAINQSPAKLSFNPAVDHLVESGHNSRSITANPISFKSVAY